jgi:signal peptidase I
METPAVTGTEKDERQQAHPEATPLEVTPPADGVHAATAGRNLPPKGSWARDLLVALPLSLVIAPILVLFFYQPVRVEGTSMLPVLEDQDRLFINKFVYRFEDIHRGDVVVFLYPNDHTTSYIKRVIALPGDDLRIDHGKVIVNGVALKETYVPFRYRDDRSLPEMTIPPHEYFVMGDHRVISSDSRDFGPVDRPLIYGKAAFVYWPMEQAGVVR